ncbi:MAG: hypothetical protein ACE1ZD_04400, partial [Dehalococcoidia bacterium]
MSQPAGPDHSVPGEVETSVEPLVESSEDLAQQIPEAVLHLQQALFAGVPWHQALLEAVGLWTR